MVRDFLELSKMRILVMQLVTFAMGYVLATRLFWFQPAFYWGLLGTGLSSAGAAYLNHAAEVDVDLKMKRTENRPLPQGRISRLKVILIGSILATLGVLVMAIFVNALCAFLAFLTVFLYVAVYTPMKRFSWMNTLVGAIPGAIPPLGGWVAATHLASVEGWFLFILLFIWQLPHFYAIAWLCRDDYRAANLKMISLIDEDGSMSARQMIIQIIFLIFVSLFPIVFGLTGWVYGIGALILGGLFMRSALLFSKDRSYENSKFVIRMSVLYLMGILILIFIPF